MVAPERPRSRAGGPAVSAPADCAGFFRSSAPMGAVSVRARVLIVRQNRLGYTRQAMLEQRSRKKPLLALALALVVGLAVLLSPWVRNVATAARDTYESLETFAIGMACRASEVRFCAVLGVSNIVGSTGATDWAQFQRAAVTRAAEVVVTWIQRGAQGLPHG